MDKKDEECPEGKVEGTDLTKCDFNAINFLTNKICKPLLNKKIDCDELLTRYKNQKIDKEEFIKTIISALGTTEDIQKVREALNKSLDEMKK